MIAIIQQLIEISIKTIDWNEGSRFGEYETKMKNISEINSNYIKMIKNNYLKSKSKNYKNFNMHIQILEVSAEMIIEFVLTYYTEKYLHAYKLNFPV